MKLVKITGRSTGLAKEVIASLSELGFVVRGYGVGDIDLNNTPSVVETVRDADVFINNANYRFSQTEILNELFKVWRDDPTKHIINISSRAAQPNISKGYLYAAQKAALEHMANNLIYNSDRMCKISTITLGLLNGDAHSVSYKAVASQIAAMINSSDECQITNITLQHTENYQLVQALKAARLKNGNK